MTLSVDPKKKTVLLERALRKTKIINLFLILAKVLLIVGIAGTALYVIVSLLLPNAWIVNVNDVPKKDIGGIIIASSFIAAPCLIFSVCLKPLAATLASSNFAARSDELLVVEEKALRYTYQDAQLRKTPEKRTVTLPFSRIRCVVFDKATDTLHFSGNFSIAFFDDPGSEKPTHKGKTDWLAICDCFTPSLREALFRNGIRVE